MSREENVFYKVIGENGLISINSGSTGAPSDKSTRIESAEFKSSREILSLMSGIWEG